MAVADAGPIIAFVRIGRLGLLRETFGQVSIPEAVYDEVVTTGKGRPGALEVAQATWIQSHGVKDLSILASLPSTLHRGERVAIALAIQLGSQLLIDEHKGREAAQQRGLEVIDSLAILAEAKRRGVIQ